MSAERDGIPNGLVGVAVAASVVVLIAMVIGVSEYFAVTLDEELQEKVLGRQAASLGASRREEAKKLSSYQWIDQKQGTLRIPVDQAVAAVVADVAAGRDPFAKIGVPPVQAPAATAAQAPGAPTAP